MKNEVLLALVSALVEEEFHNNRNSLKGPRGRDGKNGRNFVFEDHEHTISNIIKEHISSIQENLKLKFEDLTEEELLRITGPRGPRGQRGEGFNFEENKQSIEKIVNKYLEEAEENLKLKFEDLTEEELLRITGPRGPRGQRGKGFKFEEHKQAIEETITSSIDNIKETLKLKFEDLTEEDVQNLKLKFEDLTEEDVQNLKLKFEDLTEEDVQNLKLKFEDLTEDQKKEIRGPRGQRGKQGKSFVFEEHEEAISGKVNEYIDNIKETLKLKFKDLTEEEIESLKLTFKDLEEEEKQELKGPRGPRGQRGKQGVKGDKGDTGARGARGPMGPMGKQGLSGKDGINGRDGYDGKDGVDAPIVTDIRINKWNKDEYYFKFYFSDGKSIESNSFTIPAGKSAAAFFGIPGLYNPVSYIDFKTDIDKPPHLEGRLHWSSDSGTLELDTDNSGVSLQIGQEIYLPNKPEAGSNILNGQPVYVSGTNDGVPVVSLAKADLFETSLGTLALATEDISRGDRGYYTSFGIVRDIDTSAYPCGTEVYLSATVAGGITDIMPEPPALPVRLGHVITCDVTNGEIFVDINIMREELYRQIKKDPTGFVDPETTEVTYDSVARTITLNNVVKAYHSGQPLDDIYSGWVSDPHPDVAGQYFLQHDGSTVSWVDYHNVDFSNVLIAYVYYNSAKFAIRECHGLMRWPTHRNLHQTIGTFKEDGGTLGDIAFNSTTVSDRRPSVSQCLLLDEDLPTYNPSLPAGGPYIIFNLSNTDTANFTTDQADILFLNGNRPYYNNFDGSTWTQTLMSNNSYMSVWVLAIPVSAEAESQKYRFVFIQGQSNGTLFREMSVSPNEVSLGQLAELLPEFVFTSRIIIRYRWGNWSIVGVENLSGSRYSQVGSPYGVYLSTVESDTTLNGLGTVSSPLEVNTDLIATNDYVDVKAACCNANVLSDYDKIIWVGDSITEQGINGTGYTTYLENIYTQATYVYEAVGAWTTQDVIDNMATITANGEGLYVLAIGTNDARYYDSRGAQSTTEFESNIQSILDSLQAVGDVAIVSIWPTFWEDNFATEFRFATDNRMVLWNKSLARLARENGCSYFNAYDQIREYVNVHNTQELFTDGVHPATDACKKLYADSILREYVVKGSYSDEYQPVGEHFFKLVAYDNTGAAATGGFCGIKNISVSASDSFSITANSAFSSLSGLFGSYDSGYSGYYNKANDFPLYLTFGTNSFPTSGISTLGVVSGTGINRGVRSFDLFYSRIPEAVSDLDHPSWELVTTEKDDLALTLNLLPDNRNYINYMLIVDNVGGDNTNVELARCGVDLPPIRVWTQNIVSSSAQRFDLIFGDGAGTGNYLEGIAPNYVLAWEQDTDLTSIILESYNSSLGDWRLFRSPRKSALGDVVNSSWTQIASGTGDQTVTL